MKKKIENLSLIGLVLICLTGCSIPSPDFFVPEIYSSDSEVPILFTEKGGTATVAIESNCDWEVSCPADWIELSQTDGEGNVSLEITAFQTRLARNTIVTVTSNEVTSRFIEFKITQKGVKEITSVEAPVATNTESLHGNTATLTSFYESIGTEEGDVLTAGFTVTGPGYSRDIIADIDTELSIVTVTLDDLTKDNTYTCNAWVKINNGTSKNSNTTQFTTKSLPAELQAVGGVVISDETTETGTTATVKSTFITSVQIDATFDFKAGFSITDPDGNTQNVEASDIDFDNYSFQAGLTGLTAGTAYTVTPWAELYGVRLDGTVSSLKTKVLLQAGTYEFTFTSAAWSALPTGASGCKSDGESKVYTIEDNGFTWQVCGGFIENGNLRLGSANKIDYYGWAIAPKFDNLRVTKMIVPNDGKNASGKCCISIYVSEDNGASWSVVPGCDTRNTKAGEANAATWEFELEDQKPGCLYKIQNVKGTDHGNSCATKITIVVE